MIRYQYDHTRFFEFLQEYADLLQIKLENNTLVFPENIARGYMRACSLPNGLELLISDFETNTDLYLERTGASEKLFSLRFEELSVKEACEVDLGNGLEPIELSARAGSLLRNTSQPIKIMAKKGTAVRGIYLLFSQDWLKKQIGVSEDSPLLEKYFSLEDGQLNLELWDAEYRRLVDEIMSIRNHPFSKAAVQNRVMLLLERFFTRLHYKLVEKRQHDKLSQQDLHGLNEAESLLMKDFGVTPPTISQLARLAGMSPSKFKIAFKQVYGLPVYQYYLKFKMQKARDLLLSGDYPVKKVGMMLGYSNLSHFANAFRKEMGQLPSEMLN